VYLALEASGLPRDGVVYFGVIRKGACDGGQRGRNVGPEYARSGRRASVVVRLDLLSAESAEYAHGGARANADVLLTSVDGAGRVEVGLNRYDMTEQLLSGDRSPSNSTRRARETRLSRVAASSEID
jgi:hypothetical protein